MTTQKQIASIMGFSQTSVNFMLKGTRPVTWPQAERLAELFLGKDVKGWKYASPEDIKRAFDHYKIEKVA